MQSRKGEQKEHMLESFNSIDPFEKKRDELRKKLIVTTLDWSSFQRLFAQCKQQATESESIEDVKLWYTFFQKAVTEDKANQTTLDNEWRSLREGYLNVVGAIARRCGDNLDDENLMKQFLTAVDYKKNLVYAAFHADPMRDPVDDIVFEGYQKDANRLRSKQRWEAFTSCSWCRIFSKPKAAPEMKQEPVSYYQSINGPS